MTVKVSTHAPVVSNRDRVVLFTRRKIASTHDFVPFVFLGYSFHTWEHVHAVLSDKKLVVAKGCAFVNKLASTSLRFRSVIIIIIIVIVIVNTNLYLRISKPTPFTRINTNKKM